jgi:hypothetical protein
LTAFSQTDTKNNTEPVKCFPISKVKEIVKDLKSGDEAKEQLKLSDSLLVVTERKVTLKDSVISTMVIQKENYITIIGTQEKKYTILEFQLKKEKVKNKFTSILSGVAVLVLSTILIVR